MVAAISFGVRLSPKIGIRSVPSPGAVQQESGGDGGDVLGRYRGQRTVRVQRQGKNSLGLHLG